MNWFNYILNKFGQWEDPEEDFHRGNNWYRDNVNWMEKMPNGQYFWQVSLKKAFQTGRQQYGRIWDERDEIEQFGAKMRVFLEWWDKVRGPMTSGPVNMMRMVDDYTEKLEGFRPLETPGAVTNETNDVEVLNPDDFEKWMRG